MLDERMKTVYDVLRSGVTVCDVGTDHAIIPIELILSGKTDKCIITDISAPSLDKGVKNAQKAGCKNKITEYCTNGTLGVPFDEQMDFIMAGMGGELISQIIEQDIRLKNERYRFALNPMSKAEELRKYLAQNGFEVIKEVKTESFDRIYPVINCKYTAKPYDLTSNIHLLGFEKASTELERRYAEKILTALQIKLNGLKSAEAPNVTRIEHIENQISKIKTAM